MSDQNPYGQSPSGQDPHNAVPNAAGPNAQDATPRDPYGNPVPPAYGQPTPPAYGQPYGQGGNFGQQQGAYGQPTPFGAGTYGAQVPSWQQQVGFGAPANPSAYASWAQRLGAYLLDGLMWSLSSIVLMVGVMMMFSHLRYDNSLPEDEWPFFWVDGNPPTAAFVLMGVGALVAIGFWFYNWPYRQGSTGSTLGKKIVGIRVVSEQTWQPIGFGLVWLREIVHYLDSMVFYLGYLWPLWDNKRQTFADKIMTTVVVPIEPKPQADPYGSYLRS